MTPDAILFDFDYTLADSSPGIIACMNYAFASMGLSERSDAEICRTIGLHLPTAFQRLTGDSSPVAADQFAAHFVRRADEIMVQSTKMLPGAADVLEELAAAGCPVAIVTTKFRYRIEGVLRRERLSHLVGCIVGYEDVPEPKPAPDGVLLALGRLGLSADRAIYVGDSVTDAEAARRANVAFVAVLSGMTTRSDLAAFGPLAILDSVVDLPAILGESAQSGMSLRP